MPGVSALWHLRAGHGGGIPALSWQCHGTLRGHLGGVSVSPTTDPGTEPFECEIAIPAGHLFAVGLSSGEEEQQPYTISYKSMVYGWSFWFGPVGPISAGLSVSAIGWRGTCWLANPDASCSVWPLAGCQEGGGSDQASRRLAKPGFFVCGQRSKSSKRGQPASVNKYRSSLCSVPSAASLAKVRHRPAQHPGVEKDPPLDGKSGRTHCKRCGFRDRRNH